MKKYIIYLFAMTMGLCGLSSCSEETEEDNEFADWAVRNEQYLITIATDSMKQAGWQRIKNYSLNDSVEGGISDYIYVDSIAHYDLGVNKQGSPAFTDSVRVMYQGRLMPSASYPRGKFFDKGTAVGTFSVATSSTARFSVSGVVTGFTTALQKMHVGDYWRVYIPSGLGYGTAGNGTSLPGSSVLVFDLVLVDYSPVGQVMDPWQ